MDVEHGRGHHGVGRRGSRSCTVSSPAAFGGTFEDWIASLHPEDRAECLARVEQPLADPGPYMLLHRTIWRDGTVHHLECRGTVLVDDAGQPTGTTGVAIDVTEREWHKAAASEALAHQSEVVNALQHALLPAALPHVEGTQIAARYVAVQSNPAVGGDWYAVVPLVDNQLGVAIGDVAGHGIDAVADMASVRFSLRALASSEPAPEMVLERLNRMVRVFEADTMITALYGVFDPASHTWTYATVGHCPVVVRKPDGSTVLLDEPCDPPLGVATGFRRYCTQIEPGSTLVLYTDGLIERRGETITVGLDRLLRACGDGPANPEQLCDHLTSVMLHGTKIRRRHRDRRRRDRLGVRVPGRGRAVRTARRNHIERESAPLSGASSHQRGHGGSVASLYAHPDGRRYGPERHPDRASGSSTHGHDVTILHRGAHERPETPPEVVAHPRRPVRRGVVARRALADTTWDVDRRDVRTAADGRAAHRGPVRSLRIRGRRARLPRVDQRRGCTTRRACRCPVAEDARLVDDPAVDDKGYRIVRTEQAVFAAHPSAAHFRYPYLYGPYQPVPREWSVVRRILDGRRRIVVADDGLTLHHHCYTENCAAAVVRGDRAPGAQRGERSSTSATTRCSPSARWSSCARASSAPTSRSCRCPTTSPSRRGRCSRSRCRRIACSTSPRVRRQLGHRDVVPAREAVRRTARWLADHPPERGGLEEQVLTDPFDYAAEDALIDSWLAARASVARPEFAVRTGLGPRVQRARRAGPRTHAEFVE